MSHEDWHKIKVPPPKVNVVRSYNEDVHSKATGKVLRQRKVIVVGCNRCSAHREISEYEFSKDLGKFCSKKCSRHWNIKRRREIKEAMRDRKEEDKDIKVIGSSTFKRIEGTDRYEKIPSKESVNKKLYDGKSIR